MNVGAAKHTTGYALMAAAVLAYFSRPWSCGLALSQFEPEDPVPYANFDYHGFGHMIAWLLALLFAAPILWLASRIFLNGGVKVRVLGRAGDMKITRLSVVIALALGAPMHSQLSFLIGLPIRIATPVLLSSMAWLLIVEVGRTAAVEQNLLGKGAVRVVVVLALLVAVPKLTLIGLALLQH